MSSSDTTDHQLDWQASRLASCLHAADALARGKSLADSTLASIISYPVHRLTQELQTNQIPSEVFWTQLVDLSLQVDDVSQLVEGALDQSVKGDLIKTAVNHISTLVNEIVADIVQHLGKIDELLKLRAGPIRQQWEARGPGMMGRIAKFSNESLVIDNATVVLVLPALGGGGNVHPKQNCVRFEAVLTDAFGQLPETVRLAWLLTQLALIRSKQFVESAMTSSAIVNRLAALTLAMAAADFVELAQLNETTLNSAVESWIPSDRESASLASITYEWWRGFAAEESPITTEIQRLDEMLRARELA